MCFKKNMLSLIIIVFLTLTFLPAFAETAEEWKVKGNDHVTGEVSLIWAGPIKR